MAASVGLAMTSEGYCRPVTSMDRPTKDIIREVGREFIDFLVAKNEQYGDSVVSPMTIFAKGATPELLIKARIDDKIKRLVEGDDSVEPDEDILKDLAGYYIMLQVCRRVHAQY